MLGALKKAAGELKTGLEVYRLVLKDPRTPAPARVFLWLAVGYTLMPFDIIPDFIPVVGHLDDIIIVPLLLIIAVRLVPKEVIEDCRRTVSDRKKMA